MSQTTARDETSSLEQRKARAFDWFQARAYEDDPIEAGLFDLNRYYPTALE